MNKHIQFDKAKQSTSDCFGLPTTYIILTFPLAILAMTKGNNKQTETRHCEAAAADEAISSYKKTNLDGLFIYVFSCITTIKFPVAQFTQSKAKGTLVRSEILIGIYYCRYVAGRLFLLKLLQYYHRTI